MTRRAWLWLLAALGWSAVAEAGEPNDVLHAWVTGPFWITAAATREEPRYYPPGTLVNIMHCTHCGLLRLPKDMRVKTGSNLRDLRD